MQAVEQSAMQAQTRQLTPVPGGESIGGNGTIPIPTDVPEVVQKVVAGANAIADFPYVFGGGHASFVDNAYDCSGSVSYALAAGGLLSEPETSGTLESWGAPARGATSPSTRTPATPTCMWTACCTTPRGAAAYTPRAGRSGPTDNSGFVARTGPACSGAAGSDEPGGAARPSRWRSTENRPAATPPRSR